MQGVPRAHLKIFGIFLLTNECFFFSVFYGKRFHWSEIAEFLKGLCADCFIKITV